MTPNDQQELRSRQKSRAKVTALLLGAFCILMFFIAIAKIRAGMHH